MDLPEKTNFVLTDKAQFEQIVMNLVVNARDAMPKGGTITVKIADVEITRPFTTVYSDILPGKYVLFSVADTGTGIDENTLSRIFEPFFTTKGEKGTGLGLATVFGIIQGVKGYVNVTSVLGQGTTFDIYFPVCVAPVDAVEVKQEFQLPAGDATVLVVEDQLELRRIIVSGLQDKGFRVFESETAEQAVILAENSKEKIDLLITDMAMPGMTGLQLIEKLIPSRPQIKVILMSGFLDQNISETNSRTTGIEFLQKPFSHKALLEKVAVVLEPVRKTKPTK
jgi:CheY-like chemotaxis protein